MVRSGLADTVLQSLRRLLEEFDRAMDQGIDARRLQVESSAGLDQAGRKVVRIVRALDPLNHYGFARAPALLAGWTSASHVA
jgi:hypothetical protein